jgi:hypothetical protein
MEFIMLNNLYATLSLDVLRFKNTLKSIVCSPLLLILTAMFFSASVSAQDVTMPTVDIDGVDEDTSGDSIVIIVLKFVARIAVWAVMVGAGIVALRNIIKGWMAQKNNDEARWGAVIGDVIGNAVMVIFVIAFGTWVLTFLA